MRLALIAANLCGVTGIVLAACGGGGGTSSTSNESALPASTPSAPFRSGLGGRVLAGYQGWFGCPGDYDGATAWRHWFAGPASFATLTVDTFPDTSGYPAADLCDTGLARSDGSHLMLFSSQSGDVVQRHFSTMAATGIGGVALQRFVTDLQDPALKRRADHVLDLVRAAASTSGVPFFITYDVTDGGASAVDTVRADWRDLNFSLAVTSDAAYLRDGGKPVVEIWGPGLIGHPGTPSEVAALLSDLRTGANDLPVATTIGGVPTNWRTLDGDAQSDPAWAAVYRQFDVLSPWMVGRVRDEASTALVYASRIQGDLQALSGSSVRYLPVIFPGFSSYNLMLYDRKPAAAKLNEIPRRCGRLLWAQADAALSTGSSAIYVAMFDEFDEGTAVLPIVDQAGIPIRVKGVGRDADGCHLPPDWYLTLVGRLAAGLGAGSTSLGAMPNPS